MRIIISVSLIVFLLTPTFGEVLITETAIASPQNDSEVGNTEVLRDRALKNAVEAALLKHRGAVISNEKQQNRRVRESIAITNGQADESVQEERDFGQSTHVQTTGQAKIVEVVSESYVESAYQITAKISITDKSDSLQKIDAGYFWNRAGKPLIKLELQEDTSGNHNSLIPSTRSYIYDNFSGNGIDIADSGEAAYIVSARQIFSASELKEFSTFTTHCEVIYQLIDQAQEAVIYSDKKRHGPTAGFSVEQANKDCIATIVPQATKEIIKELAVVLDANWSKGGRYGVSIGKLPGDHVSVALEAIKSTFSLVSYQNMRYVDNELNVDVQFKGSAQSLIRALESSFEYTDCKLVLLDAKSDAVSFKCGTN